MQEQEMRTDAKLAELRELWQRTTDAASPHEAARLAGPALQSGGTDALIGLEPVAAPQRSVALHNKNAHAGRAEAMFEPFAGTAQSLGCRKCDEEAPGWYERATIGRPGRAAATVGVMLALGSRAPTTAKRPGCTAPSPKRPASTRAAWQCASGSTQKTPQ